jgi:hypothetical protein
MNVSALTIKRVAKFWRPDGFAGNTKAEINRREVTIHYTTPRIICHRSRYSAGGLSGGSYQRDVSGQGRSVDCGCRIYVEQVFHAMQDETAAALDKGMMCANNGAS